LSKPSVLIEAEVWKKIMHWVNKSDCEVSGLGLVKVEANNVLRVTDTILLPQRNGPTHTDIEAEDVCKALYEMRDADGELRWWWHSHVNMGVFWSGTDHTALRDFCAPGGWIAATVVNKKREYRSCFYSKHQVETPFGPYINPLMLDELPTSVTVIPDPNVAAWDAEYERNVTNRKPRSYGRVWEKDVGWVEYEPEEREVKATVEKTIIDKRPPGIKKREWKKLKDLRKGREHLIRDDRERDAYGFTQEERTFLASQGWDQEDIDFFSQQKLAGVDMIRLAEAGVEVSTIWQAISVGKSAKDIVEICLLDKQAADMLKESVS
jgi:hypothetical protein